ncbi:hypothetical protein ACFOGI_10785 [Virgibacillus xinjiangensis]|uniref:Uncharacterized protein n=1 Tax=Virgibacillus xinjiangensis TaxID=393090 RepID=A0ABV7CWA2_9BACI
MLQAILLILTAGIFFRIDYKQLKKNTPLKRDGKLHIIFSLLAITFALLYNFEVPMPNPTEGIKFIYQPAAESLRSFLDR